MFRQLSIYSPLLLVAAKRSLLGNIHEAGLSGGIECVLSFQPNFLHRPLRQPSVFWSGKCYIMFATMLLITFPHHRGSDSNAVLAGWKSTLRPCCSITSQNNMLFMIVQIVTFCVTLTDVFVDFCVFKL